MPTAPEALFDSLHSTENVRALTGTSEDSILDCKQWLGDEKSKRLMIAKAVSGFANGDGGVVVVGLIAESRGKDDPDLIKGPAYVAAPEEVKAKILSYIQADVEPMIQSLKIAVVRMESDNCGVVIVLVPSQDGLPVRSKQDWKFYLRSGSSTQNMPLTVLADRFGRRPHAELRASFSEPRIESLPGAGVRWARVVDLYVENTGRGLARFPVLLLYRDSNFVPFKHPYGGAPEHLWPLSNADVSWMSFRGGAEAVVYPGEKLRICRVDQATYTEPGASPKFAQAFLHIGAMCEGAPVVENVMEFSAESM